jgi:predicted transcriptional regulator
VSDEKEQAGQSISSLFMELASETRFSILMSLDKKSARLSSLSRELNTTAQDIFRNLNRMAEEGLVRKSDGEFSITDYGAMVVKQVPYFSFLRKHRKFFETHSLAGSEIPGKFLLRVGELADCSIINSVTAVFQRLKKLESCANTSIKVWCRRLGLKKERYSSTELRKESRCKRLSATIPSYQETLSRQ